jgi:hypothetical protein
MKMLEFEGSSSKSSAEPEAWLRPPSYWENITLFLNQDVNDEEAIQWASDLSRICGADLSVVGMIDRPLRTSVLGAKSSAGGPEAQVRAMKLRLESVCGRVYSAREGAIEVIAGDPARIVTAHLAASKPDLAILALPKTANGGGCPRAIVEKVVKSSPVPVLALNSP